MREKFIKFIFFAVVVSCISFGIYSLYKKNKNLDIGTGNKKIEENKNSSIVIGVAEIDTNEFLYSKNQDMNYIYKLIYTPLINITEDFKLEPCLASEWSKINEKTYLIKLKNDMYFHDGTNFTSKNLEYTVNLLKNEDTIYSENVKNIDKLEIIDDFTVKIFLAEEIPFFEYYLSFPIINNKQYIGTGKYKLSEITDEKITLELAEKNSDINLKMIEINIYKTNAELYTAFLKEEIDLMITTNVNFKNYIGNIGFKEQKVTGRNFDYIKINLDNNFLKNKEVRQAINYAINKNEIVYGVYNNYYKIANFPLEYGNFLYENKETNTYDISKSKQVLSENGWQYLYGKWRKNGRFLELSLIVDKENNERCEVAKLIKAELADIGIIINIREVSNSEYNRILNNGNYELILTGNCVPITPDIQTYFNKEETNSQVQSLKDIENIEILKSKYKELIDLNNEEVLFIGLYFNTNIIVYNTNLRGNFDGNWFNLFYNIETLYKI